MGYTSKDRGFLTTMLGTSVYSKNTRTKQSGNTRTAVSGTKKKAASFEEDYQENVKKKQQELLDLIKSDPLAPSDDFREQTKTIASDKKQNATSLSALPEKDKESGANIKERVTEQLSEKYGKLNIKHLFDGIDDKDVENNIPLAKDTIQKGIDTGKLEKNYPLRLPNLLNGLALSYAAADKGNNKAATRAREAAYMENKINSFDPLTEMLKKQSDAKKSKIRYVKVDEGSNLNLRSAPGIGNTSLAKMPRGTQVDFTGNKVSLGDKQWAEVEYNGQKGWVDADYLKIDVPEGWQHTLSDTPLNQGEEKTIDKIHQFNTPWFINTLTPLKAEDIQKKFNSVGDVDGNGLECPDIVKWYVDAFTVLNSASGNGNEQVAKIVEENKLPEEAIITDPEKVTFPAIYSVHKDIAALGTSGSAYGHTGIIIGRINDNGVEKFKVIHTYNKLKNNANISDVREYEIPPGGVSYLNLKKYLK